MHTNGNIRFTVITDESTCLLISMYCPKKTTALLCPFSDQIHPSETIQVDILHFLSERNLLEYVIRNEHSRL